VGSEGIAGFKPRIDAAKGQFFGAGTSEDGVSIQEMAPRRGRSTWAAKHLGGERLVIDSALVA
jgi:hypothetical protein